MFRVFSFLILLLFLFLPSGVKAVSFSPSVIDVYLSENRASTFQLKVNNDQNFETSYELFLAKGRNGIMEIFDDLESDYEGQYVESGESIIVSGKINRSELDSVDDLFVIIRPEFKSGNSGLSIRSQFAIPLRTYISDINNYAQINSFKVDYERISGLNIDFELENLTENRLVGLYIVEVLDGNMLITREVESAALLAGEKLLGSKSLKLRNISNGNYIVRLLYYPMAGAEPIIEMDEIEVQGFGKNWLYGLLVIFGIIVLYSYRKFKKN